MALAALAGNVGPEGQDLTGYLGADVNHFLRFERAGGTDAAGQTRVGAVVDERCTTGVDVQHIATDACNVDMNRRRIADNGNDQASDNLAIRRIRSWK